ncbi:MAG: leucine-rich repeat protein [Bacteroidales bacterium]|nr:leucine-rich repeat protein [Bacteroidales bacterium]MDD3913962.1 leucine-rich repeat protein [Bacteroidales bacterium]
MRKTFLTKILTVCVCTAMLLLTSCGKEEVKVTDENHGYDSQNTQIQQNTKAVIVDGATVVEVAYEDGTKMYFKLCQTMEAKVVNYTYYYDSANYNSGYIYAGDVVIPETVIYEDSTYTVTGICDAFADCDLVTSVNIPSTVEEICGNAFTNCIAMTEVVCMATVPPTFNCGGNGNGNGGGCNGGGNGNGNGGGCNGGGNGNGNGGGCNGGGNGNGNGGGCNGGGNGNGGGCNGGGCNGGGNGNGGGCNGGGTELFAGCEALQNIFVPVESVDAYKIAEGWSDYADIIIALRDRSEVMPSPIYEK